MTKYELCYMERGKRRVRTSVSFERALRRARLIASERDVDVEILECRRPVHFLRTRRLVRILAATVYAGGLTTALQLSLFDN